MTPERFQQIEELYHAVRERTAEERSALLEQADPEVRREVESLLTKRKGGEFLEQPVIGDAANRGSDSTSAGLAPGTRLGPYLIEAKLGEGGMGEVYRAIDTRLGRALAIKIIREQFNARFDREARAISSLNHPNICTLFDIGTNYLVMELVEGETLVTRLKGGPLPLETVLVYASQIAAALAEAHAKSIIHRDLKPGNIMIGKTGIKILDFGLARSGQDETMTGSNVILGTPAYMAPEQRKGGAIDARADIYAFGHLLYEMLTGERAADPRRRIRARRLETIVSRCFEQDPERRWQSAAELQQELAALPRPKRGLYVTVGSSARRPSNLLRKSKILLGEFENKTGDPVLDGVLRHALSVPLEQSASLSVVSDQQIQQVLRFMNRPAQTSVTSEVAQEICERAGGIAVLEGSIASLGSRYVLSIRARNCRTGDMLCQEQIQVGSKEEVLDALTAITVRTRDRLTESLATKEEQSTPLEQATTHSLEALRAYTAARSALFAHGFSAAIPHLRRAIALDPEFAMAQADLGFFYWNIGQTDAAMEPVLKAHALRHRVSDWERFFILFLYDRQATGNLHKELETIEAWVHTYPQDWQAWSVLSGWGTRGTGQYERGLQAAKEAIRLKPQLPIPYDGMIAHNFALGRFSEAAAWMQRAADRKLELPIFVARRYYLAFLTGDEAGMKREADRARGNAEAEDWMSHNQALVLAHSGQMRNARTMWRHAVELAQQAGNREKAAIYEAARAVCEAHSHNWANAEEHAQRALVWGKGRDVVYSAAFALALSGKIAEAQALAEDLAQRFPEDTPVQFEYLSVLRALFALHKEAPWDAVERLQTALPYDLAMPGTAFFAMFGGLYPAYVRGVAFLRAGHGWEAAAEFQKVLDHRGIVFADPIGALAHLQQGRAYVLSGQSADARKAYETFFAVWKNADADIAIFQEARNEYLNLG